MRNLKVWLFCSAVIASGFAQASSMSLNCEGEQYDATVTASASGKHIQLEESNSGRTLTGICDRAEHALEISMNCFIPTSTDSGYELKIVSAGGIDSVGSLQKWSMNQATKLEDMSCTYSMSERSE